jgi:hypothetical protein
MPRLPSLRKLAIPAFAAGPRRVFDVDHCILGHSTTSSDPGGIGILHFCLWGCLDCPEDDNQNSEGTTHPDPHVAENEDDSRSMRGAIRLSSALRVTADIPAHDLAQYDRWRDAAHLEFSPGTGYIQDAHGSRVVAVTGGAYIDRPQVPFEVIIDDYDSTGAKHGAAGNQDPLDGIDQPSKQLRVVGSSVESRSGERSVETWGVLTCDTVTVGLEHKTIRLLLEVDDDPVDLAFDGERIYVGLVSTCTSR